MLKNFQVIKIKWERRFAYHLSVSPTLSLKCDFHCASLVGKPFMVRADIMFSCILFLWQARENISLSQVYDYDAKLYTERSVTSAIELGAGLLRY
jgi:hypothetical protein